MTSLTFDTCCGCIELRTGCLIIGYLNLVYSIFMVILTLVLALGAGVALSQADFSELHAKHPEITKGEATAAISVVAILIVLIVLLFLIFNIVFVVGVHQNKRGHVKAYLIFSVIFLVLYTIMFLAGFAQPSINWGSVFSTIFFILLSVYFLLVIRSYYYKMNDTSRQPAIYNTGA